jgi:hypothetical protein
MSRRNLPPLQADTAYLATDFEDFEYSGAPLTGSKAILRLHLKNRTTIDLPTDEAGLKNLLLVLCEAFPEEALSRLVERGLAARM